MIKHRPPARCFQGVIPAVVGTCSKDGTPNAAYLSQVFAIDDTHVALSCQFFNKTKQNSLENPYACLELYDPVSFELYRMDLRFERAETSGPLFDSMALRIQAIASHTGMTGVFKLISSDVYEVLACEKVEGFLEPAPVEIGSKAESLEGPRSELRGLQLVSQRLCRAARLEDLLTTLLATLEEAFGFEHSMVLLLDESGQRLYTVASRGYGDEGVGSEVKLGEGLIGAVAAQRKLLRFSGVEEDLRYGRAIRAAVHQSGGRRELRPEIALPGLADAQSHMGLPLVSGERLLGVLAVESKQRLGFDEWDEAFLEIVANQVAVSLDNVLLREAEDDEEEEVLRPSQIGRPSQRVLRFKFFRNDDCVFIDDEYLIRNVPGRILWKILRAHADSGRTEFSNRELRLDPWLGLPAVRDNLESRLVLLRKRLEQKCPELSLVSTARGHFRLEAQGQLLLEETDGA
ncbi:MAG TPA: GAF domain-containing protein [Polyangiales bacterium]|nr:GAF domain-containing protein [Polyangiales bacterium]